METKELIELQLTEVEMLQSMYPNEEFCVDDPSVISEARSVVDGEHDDIACLCLFRPISFRIKLTIGEPKVGS